MSSKQGNFKNQVCVLRVNIHCDGCKKKVKKLLQKIEGVDATMIDAELGKVTVSGYVHPNTLINKLVKSGKHAELWAAQRNKPFAAQNQLMNQFTDLRFEELGKPRKGGKVFSKDLNTKSGPKHPKSVKFDLRDDEEFLGSDGGFSESDDEGDGFELDFGRRAPSRTPTRGDGAGGNGQHGTKQKKNGQKGPGKNGKSGGGVRPKKGGIFGIRLLFFKGFGRKKKCKNASAGKKGGGGGEAKGSCMKQGAIEFKSGGKNGGWVLENGKNGGKATAAAAPKNGGKDFRSGNNQGNGGKNGRGGGKNADFQEIDFSNHRKGGGSGGGGGGAGYGGGDGFAGRVGPMGSYPVGQMGNNSLGPMGNYPMGPLGNNSVSPMGPMGPPVNNFAGPMGQYPAGGQMGAGPGRQMGHYQAVQGLPAATPMTGGYYPPGMGPMNHHQYMGMMMNQPHPQPNGAFHPAMYGRPHPMTGYAPHRPSDGYTNMFNDENTESCSIM